MRLHVLLPFTLLLVSTAVAQTPASRFDTPIARKLPPGTKKLDQSQSLDASRACAYIVTYTQNPSGRLPSQGSIMDTTKTQYHPKPTVVRSTCTPTGSFALHHAAITTPR